MVDPQKKPASGRKNRNWLSADNYFYGKVLFSSLIGVVAIAVLATVLVNVALRDHRHDSRRSRALEIIGTAHKIEADLAALETAHRGYLLTGRNELLQSFNARKEQAHTRFVQLAALLSDDNVSRKEVLEGSQNLDSWLSSVAEPALEARRAAGANPAALPGSEEILSDAADKSLLDSARQSLRTVEDQKQISLINRSEIDHSAQISFETLLFAPKLGGVISEMQKTESGYLLTGDKLCLDAYRKASGIFTAYYGHLSVLLADDPDQSETLKRIRNNVERWQRDTAHPRILACEQGKPLAALLAIDSSALDEARTETENLEKTQLETYAAAKSKMRIGRVTKTVALGLLCGLAIAVLLGANWYNFVAYRRHLRRIELAEAQTRAIVETTLDGILTITSQGVIDMVNPAAEKMFDYPASALVGQNIAKVIPQRLFWEDISTRSQAVVTTIGHRRNHRQFPIEISLNEMTVSGRKQFVALIRDVSERQRSEEMLKRVGSAITATGTREVLRSLLKQLAKTMETEFAFLLEVARPGEQGSYSLMVVEHGHVRLRPNFTLGGSAIDEALKKGFRMIQAGARASFPGDELLRELEAESFAAAPLLDRQGRTLGVIGIFDQQPILNEELTESALRIIASRGAAEIELKRSADDVAAEKERLGLALRLSKEGFIGTTAEGTVVMMNDAAQALTGWSEQEAFGKRLTDVFSVLHERTRKPSPAIIERIIETASIYGSANKMLLVARNGSTRLVENEVAPIRNSAGQRSGLVLLFRDVTDLSRLEETQRRADKLESLGAAAGRIAHDFNNLLTAIVGSVSLAQSAVPAESEVAEQLAAAKRASGRAQELAQQLLTFSKGGAPIKKTLSIVQLLRENVTAALRGSNIRSDFELDGDLWPVEVDPGQIGEVLKNLASNAEQAMPAGGTVRIKASNLVLEHQHPGTGSLRPGRYVQIVVQDEGIGIPEEYLGKIFDAYFTTKPRGAGLGLTTAYSIVKNHGGIITVESQPGAGATFSVHLPASEKTAEPEPIRSGRVLVLDDEEIICELITHALAPMGMEVVPALDAETAIELFKQSLVEGRRFDLLITDLTLPGGTGGKEVVQTLSEMDPDLKAIVSSGYKNDPVMSRCNEFGFCAAISKPYELEELAKVVQEAMQSAGPAPVYRDPAQGLPG